MCVAQLNIGHFYINDLVSLDRFCFIKPCSLEDPKLKAIVSKFDAALRLESNSPLHQLLGAISPKLTKMFNPGYTGTPY